MVPPAPNPLSQAVWLFERGRLAEAAAQCAKVLQAQPRNFEAVYFLGLVRGNQGRLAEAAQCFEKAVALDPQSFAAHRNLGVALGGLGRHDAAVASFETALSLKPGDAQTHNDLGVVFAGMHRFDRAIASFETALALAPAAIDALNNLGAALSALNRDEEAIASFERMVALRPGDADAHNNLGAVLSRTKRYEPAIRSFQRALAIEGDHVDAQNGLGVAFAATGRYDAALACFERASALRPDHAEAPVNAVNALKSLKRYDAALARCEAVLAARPDDAGALTLCAALRRHLCDWRTLDQIDGRVIDHVQTGRGAILPFVFLTLADDPALQLACARRYWSSRKIAARPLAARPSGDGRKLRLGYLSADFHEHATARLAAELFERHDRTQFEVFAFSSGPDDASAMRRRLEKAFDHFVDIRNDGDDRAARRIHEHDIDILVDLKGHTEDGRLEILARRPAPVQVHYLGYPGTIGVDFIDYMLVDRFIVPPGSEQYFAEKLVYLPGSYQVNDRLRTIAENAPARAECGLPERGFVFCCFNNSYKIAAPVFALWMRLLTAVSGSVLWLLADNEAAAENLRREAAAHGIDPARLVFAPRLPLAQHLARHRWADLFLDTMPVNAHTTASDALWAGLPIVTCAGRSFVARVAGSLLHALGLAELVTEDLAAYERLALALAQQPERLAALKEHLGAARQESPLFDASRTCRYIEAAYREMWEIRRRGDPPRDFAVSSSAAISATA